jgi:Pyruvate/2-oxoacid:ferredoxin oxidoreductase delta subunit
MGHLASKDVYRKLGRKIDGLTVRVPWNETLHSILRALYSTEEADLVVRMPFGLATIGQIEKTARLPRAELQRLLESLCTKGLVMDISIRGECHYIISPLVIGIFEFTMMRTRGDLKMKEWADLFHTYLQSPGTFYAANFGGKERVSPLRTLPHEEAIDGNGYVEVLDYEKASAILESAKSFAIGLCSCRHEKLHAGLKECDVPLETCSTLGPSTELMIRHNFGRLVSQSEMRDNMARSRDLGLVLLADNVRQDISFICHCCGCCCNVLLGVSKFGYPNTVVTSTFIAHRAADLCSQCGTCAEACPIEAFEVHADAAPEVDTSACIGCGVCATKCPTGAMTLIKREQRVLHPETTIERVILQCLERGTLQNQMFPDPERITHAFMRAFVGAFLKLPPVKRALMSNTLRSRFLMAVQRGA